MSTWFNERIQAITICLQAGLPEAALALLYSAIDTLAFLGAPDHAQGARPDFFIKWCDSYLTALINSGVRGIDLYGARCGILHTSSACSDLGQKGCAREIWHRIEDRTGVNLMTNTPEAALVVDVEVLISAFAKAGQRFISDLASDQVRLEIVSGRIKQFFSWGHMWP